MTTPWVVLNKADISAGVGGCFPIYFVNSWPLGWYHDHGTSEVEWSTVCDLYYTILLHIIAYPVTYYYCFVITLFLHHCYILIRYYYIFIITCYYDIITCYYIIIMITSKLGHYYVIINSLSQMAEAGKNELIITSLISHRYYLFLPFLSITTSYQSDNLQMYRSRHWHSRRNRLRCCIPTLATLLGCQLSASALTDRQGLAWLFSGTSGPRSAPRSRLRVCLADWPRGSQVQTGHSNLPLYRSCKFYATQILSVVRSSWILTMVRQHMTIRVVSLSRFFRKAYNVSWGVWLLWPSVPVSILSAVLSMKSM